MSHRHCRSGSLGHEDLSQFTVMSEFKDPEMTEAYRTHLVEFLSKAPVKTDLLSGMQRAPDGQELLVAVKRLVNDFFVYAGVGRRE